MCISKTSRRAVVQHRVNQGNQVNGRHKQGTFPKCGDPQGEIESSITYSDMQLIATGTICGRSPIQPFIWLWRRKRIEAGNYDATKSVHRGQEFDSRSKMVQDGNFHAGLCRENRERAFEASMGSSEGKSTCDVRPLSQLEERRVCVMDW